MFSFLLIALMSTGTVPDTDLAAQSAKFSFHNNPWINEHHFLYHVAKNDMAGVAFKDLDEVEREVMQAAVDHYRKELIERHLLFDDDRNRIMKPMTLRTKSCGCPEKCALRNVH